MTIKPIHSVSALDTEARDAAMAALRTKAPNFRDLGGYAAVDGRRTRSGRVFRSNHLSHFEAEQWDALRALGVQAIVDLRDAREASHDTARLPADFVRVSVEFLPEMLPSSRMLRGDGAAGTEGAQGGKPSGSDFMIALYRDLIVHRRDQLQRVFATLADPSGGAVLVHCTAGKDRTGIVSAMLLDLAGVDRSTIVQDYTISDAAMRAIFALRDPKSIGAVAPVSGIDAEFGAAMMRADARYVVSALDALDAEFGGVSAYLADGLGADAIARARDDFLETVHTS